MGSSDPDVCAQVDFDAQVERAARERDAAGGLKLSHRQAAYREFGSCEAYPSTIGESFNDDRTISQEVPALVRWAADCPAAFISWRHEHCSGFSPWRGRRRGLAMYASRTP